MCKYFSTSKKHLLLLYAISLSVILNSCAKEKEPINEKNIIQLRNSYHLNLPEPSGLALSPDRKSLYTVSDENSTVYKLSLTGEIQDSFVLDGIDLEGITFFNDSTLAVVLERSREILFCTLNGTTINKIKIYLEGELNSGLEGIEYDPGENTIYLLNEKKPVLLLKVDDNFNIKFEKELKFSTDVSGMYLQESDLWILSDESKSAAVCNREGELLKMYKIPVQQPEGIAVDDSENLVYIVSDFTGTLYVFSLQ